MATNAENSQLKKATEGGVSSPMTPSTGASQAPEAQQSRVANYSTGSTLGPSSQGSGRFTNVKNYINANTKAGEQLGNKLTTNVQSGITKTEKEQNTQAGNIASNIQAERDRLAKGNQFNTQLQDQSAAGAQAINADQQQKEAFQKLATDQNVAGNLATQAQNQAGLATSAFNQLGQQIGNLGSEQGRFAALQQAVKNPQYTQGQQRLDQLFLQTGNPNQLVQAQRQLGKQAEGAAQALQNRYTGLGTEIGNVGTQAADVAKMLQGTLGSETQNLIQAQADEAKALNKSNDATNLALQTLFSNGTLTPEQQAIINPILQSGGLSTGMRTYNVLSDPQSYTKYLNDISRGNTAADLLDQQEFDRYSALRGLGNQALTDFTQAGAGAVQSGLQSQKLASDIQDQRRALEQQLNQQYSSSGMTSTGAFSGGSTAKANFLDLLKYFEDPNKYVNGNQASITPITSTYTYGRTDDPRVYMTPTTAGINSSTPTKDTAKFTGANYGNSIQSLLDMYDTYLNDAGYRNILGGIEAPRTDVVNIPGAPKIRGPG